MERRLAAILATDVGVDVNGGLIVQRRGGVATGAAPMVIMAPGWAGSMRCQGGERQ